MILLHKYAFRVLSLLVLAGLLLVSCARKQVDDAEPGDGPSSIDLTADQVADAIPKVEPLARYGNHSPYEVFGKKYYVLESGEGYHKKGVASWYGSKFHGRRTSSGEPYDMHLATAAHKTLPLPSYAEVTNLDNGRQVIVKINDRGPFKDDRLIDMSYGAAIKLDMIASGTARVDLRVLETPVLSAGNDGPLNQDGETETWLQAGAYSRRKGAEKLARDLEQAKLSPVTVLQFGDLFRVWLGPYVNNNEVQSVISRAIELGFERPHRVSH